MRRLRLAAALLGVAIAAVFVTTATAHHRPAPGFKTSQDAMLDCPTCKSVTPIITVGETLPGSTYRFESIPDGIALVPGKRGGDDDDDDDGKRTAEILVNHETSTVPFQGLNDFDNSQLSRLTLNTRTAGVLSGFFAIPSSANYQRLCSNFMATKEHGFSRPLLFTNEEAADFVNRTGTAFPGTPGEQAGVVVAYDPANGQYKTIYGMGRHNHENSVALKGYKKPVVLSTDDTFNAPSSQLYMYLANNADEVWNDQGSLWAFKPDIDTINDYGDLSSTGPVTSVSGKFIPVPRAIAIGDQTGLENWSNDNNAFQFIRLEDIAYDRKKPNVVYIADTGEPRAIPNPATGRLQRQASSTPPGPWSNGRIFRFEFDKKNPTIVKKLSILIDGDVLGAAGIKNLALLHQPDNLETTKEHLYIQEDPGSHNQYAINDPNGTPARIWQYDLKRKTLRVLATVNQAADEGPTDVDPSMTPALWGAWESSGIVDASSIFGKGAFLVDIQAPTLIVERQVINGLPHEREGGQLLLIRLGGGGHHDDDDDDDDDD